MRWFSTLLVVFILTVACVGTAPTNIPASTVDVGATVDAAVEATRAVERAADATAEAARAADATAEAARAAVPTPTPVVPTPTPVVMTIYAPTPEPYVAPSGQHGGGNRGNVQVSPGTARRSGLVFAARHASRKGWSPEGVCKVSWPVPCWRTREVFTEVMSGGR